MTFVIISLLDTRNEENNYAQVIKIIKYIVESSVACSWNLSYDRIFPIHLPQIRHRGGESRRSETENHPSALGTRVNHSGRLRLSAKFTAASYTFEMQTFTYGGRSLQRQLVDEHLPWLPCDIPRPILNSRSSWGSGSHLGRNTVYNLANVNSLSWKSWSR